MIDKESKWTCAMNTWDPPPPAGCSACSVPQPDTSEYESVDCSVAAGASNVPWPPSSWQVGYELDVKDDIGGWYNAKVVALGAMPTPESGSDKEDTAAQNDDAAYVLAAASGAPVDRIRVHFKGWAAKWDEWVQLRHGSSGILSSRLAPVNSRAHTTGNEEIPGSEDASLSDSEGPDSPSHPHSASTDSDDVAETMPSPKDRGGRMSSPIHPNVTSRSASQEPEKEDDGIDFAAADGKESIAAKAAENSGAKRKAAESNGICEASGADSADEGTSTKRSRST
eukprot:SAG31_NODE_1273_length_9057_cov_13.364103_4_plen_282_part_00